MFMRVSARLQAKAAPAAPAPTINTSTGSSDILDPPFRAATVSAGRGSESSPRRGTGCDAGLGLANVGARSEERHGEARLSVVETRWRLDRCVPRAPRRGR